MLIKTLANLTLKIFEVAKTAEISKGFEYENHSEITWAVLTTRQSPHDWSRMVAGAPYLELSVVEHQEGIRVFINLDLRQSELVLLFALLSDSHSD